VTTQHVNDHQASQVSRVTMWTKIPCPSLLIGGVMIHPQDI
jgi:hypothetical protein